MECLNKQIPERKLDVVLPITIGKLKTDDFINSLENHGDFCVAACPFCESKKSLFLPNGQDCFFCNSCWVVGARDELKALLNGDDYKAVRNRRRAEYRKLTEHNCKANGFVPDKYVSPDADWQTKAEKRLTDLRKQFERFSGFGIKGWLDERGIYILVAVMYGVGVWRTGIDKFDEESMLIPTQHCNCKVAVRGVIIPNYRKNKLIRIRIITQIGSMSFPKDLTPIPAVIKDNVAPSRIYFIVKNELEMLLLSQYSGQRFNIVGLGEPGIKPDRDLHFMLRNSDLILVCLDNELEGMSEHSEWWLRIYPQARWYPYPVGESLNDAYVQKVDIADYVKKTLTYCLT